MVFIKDLGKTHVPESSFSTKCAKELAAALSKINKVRKLNLEEWGREFSILRKDHSKEEISRVLDWYTQNIRGEFTPLLRSANGFRRKFEQLQKICDRSTHTQEVKISQEAKDIAKRFDHMNWRGTEKKLLAHFVQVSLDNYRIFHTALKTLFHKLKLESEEKTRKHPGIVKSKEWSETRLVQHLVELIPTEGDIIQKWVGMANYACWNYPNWKGDMLPFAFHYDHNRFQVMMAGYVADWRGDGGDWDRIRQMIYKLIPDNKTHGQP